MAEALDSFTISHSYDVMEKLRKRLDKCYSSREKILVAVESHQSLLIYTLLEVGYKEFKSNPAHQISSSLPTGEITAARLNGELGSDGARYPTREYV